MKFIDNIVLAANGNGNVLDIPPGATWNIHPAVVDRVQTSSTSCGLWTLAQIGALLHGAHVTGISESDTGVLRNLLYTHVLSLPPVK
jgi:hypothetical protein